MTTRELIQELLAVDPTGETDVCIGNETIVYVDKLPAYYDGVMEKIILDKSMYDFTGAKYVRQGMKVCIYSRSIKDVLSDKYDLIIDYSELNPDRAKEYKESNEKWIEECKKIDKEIENEQIDRGDLANSP